ncbi:hypothetical protein CEP51_005738 [Fusarium floridanum]|uniref:Uncharacterized protein n=1 Tax=Fusarium floridanum TaxID=1325733 RepID=A0A428RVN4_9HYPO|nr:hypothetical protein CEP51_005738 [Fusarium floridanum]
MDVICCTLTKHVCFVSIDLVLSECDDALGDGGDGTRAHAPLELVTDQNFHPTKEVAWPNGKASDYESEDSGFDPQRDHFFGLSFSSPPCRACLDFVRRLGMVVFVTIDDYLEHAFTECDGWERFPNDLKDSFALICLALVTALHCSLFNRCYRRLINTVL